MNFRTDEPSAEVGQALLPANGCAAATPSAPAESLLRERLDRLEKELRLRNRHHHQRTAAAVALVLTICISVLAQSSAGPITLQSLSKRIDTLEQRVVNDEASGANIPQPAGNSSTPASGNGSSNSAGQANQALAKRVSDLEQEVAELKAEPTQQRFVNDELRIAHLEAAIAQLRSASSSGPASTQNGIATLKAPFQIVGTSGQPILKVTEGAQGSGDLQLLKGGTAYTTLNWVEAINAGDILMTDSTGNAVTLGFTQDGPMLLLNDHGDRAYIAHRRATNSLGLYLGKGDSTAVSVDLEGGVGNVHLFNGNDQVGAFSTTKNGAKLQMNGPGGGKSVVAGISDEDSDPFVRVNSAGGSGLIGAPSGNAFGFRIYGADGKTANAGMIEDAQGNSSITIARQGIPRVSMAVGTSSGIIGVLDKAGGKYASSLTSYDGDGGALKIANSSGQIVAMVDANPTNNQGRAVFTDTGGNPLAKIGAAGAHGDVLLGGPDKAIAVWEFMLTGMR
jgi:hypothetical protein